jgi:hypothetical protein
VTDKQLAPGQSLSVGGYTLTYTKLEERQRAMRPRLARCRRPEGAGDRSDQAGKNAYSSGPSTEVGSAPTTSRARICTDAEEINSDGTVQFRLVKPLVNLIWLAGLVFLLDPRPRCGWTRVRSDGWLSVPRGRRALPTR